MTDSAKKPSQAQLKKAYEILMAASPRDRKFLFKGFIENLEEQRQKLAKGEDKKFDPLYRISINAADDVSRFVRRLIGYNPTWTTEYLLEYGHYSNATKYSFDDRQLFIWFIHSLVIRGASQTQAIELAKQVLNKKKMLTWIVIGVFQENPVACLGDELINFLKNNLTILNTVVYCI